MPEIVVVVSASEWANKSFIDHATGGGGGGGVGVFGELIGFHWIELRLACPRERGRQFFVLTRRLDRLDR